MSGQANSRKAETFGIVLPWPTGVTVNNLYARGRWGLHLTDRAQAWRDEVILRVRLSGQTLPDGDLALLVWLGPPNRRRRDADNLIKLLQDAIFAAVGQDDSRVKEEHVWMAESRPGHGFIEVTIRAAIIPTAMRCRCEACQLAAVSG